MNAKASDTRRVFVARVTAALGALAGAAALVPGLGLLLAPLRKARVGVVVRSRRPVPDRARPARARRAGGHDPVRRGAGALPAVPHRNGRQRADRMIGSTEVHRTGTRRWLDERLGLERLRGAILGGEMP